MKPFSMKSIFSSSLRSPVMFVLVIVSPGVFVRQRSSLADERTLNRFYELLRQNLFTFFEGLEHF